MFVTRSVKLVVIFSVACTLLNNGLPSRSVPPPPSLMTSAASISPLWFLSSQSTPLAGPLSSSAVSAMMMSRSGTNPSRFMRYTLATKIDAIALSSAVPRP